MQSKRLGRHTVRLAGTVSVVSFANVGGRLESQGPLAEYFDELSQDSYFGSKSWEQAESLMQVHALHRALAKGGLEETELDYVLAGDLLNQCIGTSFGLRSFHIPFYGLYGACSTMGESLSLAALLIDGGFARLAAAMTSSHFCTAERQYRMPVPYGSQRTPTAQWTATAAGACLLRPAGEGVQLCAATFGRVQDYKIKDINNMGAAMAPAAYETLKAHFADTGRTPDYYDLIVTGDLGKIGHTVVTRLFQNDGIELEGLYTDCGLLIYDLEGQDVHAGGSGCGCSAAVLAGHLLKLLAGGQIRRLLFAATGALMSPTASMQGESIPGISHAVAIETQVNT